MPTFLPSQQTPDQNAPVNVSIGNVPPTDNAALYVEDDGIWEDYWCLSRYETDHHVYQLGITSAGGFNGAKAAFVQLAAPTTIWIVDWTLEKRTDNGDYPIFPDSAPTDGNTVLLDQHFEPAMLDLGADGTSVIYRFSGTYVYGFKDSLKAVMKHGRPPWMSKVVKRNVDMGKKQTGII